MFNQFVKPAIFLVVFLFCWGFVDFNLSLFVQVILGIGYDPERGLYSMLEMMEEAPMRAQFILLLFETYLAMMMTIKAPKLIGKSF